MSKTLLWIFLNHWNALKHRILWWPFWPLSDSVMSHEALLLMTQKTDVILSFKMHTRTDLWMHSPNWPGHKLHHSKCVCDVSDTFRVTTGVLTLFYSVTKNSNTIHPTILLDNFIWSFISCIFCYWLVFGFKPKTVSCFWDGLSIPAVMKIPPVGYMRTLSTGWPWSTLSTLPWIRVSYNLTVWS